MRKSSPYIVILLGLLGSLPFLASAQKARVAEDKFGFFLDGDTKVIRIPFEFHSNLIIVPVQIHGSDTLHFILDTCVSTTLITDPKALASQNLRLTRPVVLAGAGEGENVTAHVALDNSLSMNRMKANHQNILVLDEDFLHLSEYVGAVSYTHLVGAGRGRRHEAARLVRPVAAWGTLVTFYPGRGGKTPAWHYLAPVSYTHLTLGATSCLASACSAHSGTNR